MKDVSFACEELETMSSFLEPALRVVVSTVSEQLRTEKIVADDESPDIFHLGAKRSNEFRKYSPLSQIGSRGSSPVGILGMPQVKDYIPWRICTGPMHSAMELPPKSISGCEPN
eukprot:jgi/Picsp_1/5199/NSC_02562-R1_---NA---